GYRLSSPPAEVHLGSVLLALGEPLFEEPGYCEQHRGTETDGACVHLGSCTLRALWHTLELWMRQALDQLTLADLLANEGRVTELLRSRLSEAVSASARVPLTSLGKRER